MNEKQSGGKPLEKKAIDFFAIHDFAGKLGQASVLPRVREYVLWQIESRRARQEGKVIPLPAFAPVSINLDLTVACGFACEHCVDKKILNQGQRFEHDKLSASLEIMAQSGLKSVIVIGGGEPTLYPQFGDVIRLIKSLGLQVAVVSNGSGNAKIAEIAGLLDEYDWVRLSLDAGSDEIFQALHRPKKPISLDEICAHVPGIKAANSLFRLGYSFVVTWKGTKIHGSDIVENLPEMFSAAERAKKYRFDYIAFKPFLTRSSVNHAEVVDLKAEQEHFRRVTTLIQEQLAKARTLEGDGFRVYATTNLKVLLNESAGSYSHQPRHCHMQFFRQVLSPLGIFNCPAYRNQEHGRLGEKDGYSSPENFGQTLERTRELMLTFDASQECREVTCLYHHVNWWLEDLIAHPEKLESLTAREMEEPDYFL